MADRIEDAEKEFLKIDFSATSFIKSLLNNGHQTLKEFSLSQTLKDSKSNQIEFIMNPQSNLIFCKIL